MRRTILLVVALIISVCGTASFSKNSSQLQDLSSAWKMQKFVQLNQNKNLAMVYGGEDVANPPSLQSTITA